MLPVVAVQFAPGPPPPVLEERLLSACSAGLKRARCAAAPQLSAESAAPPRAIAVVSWADPAHVSIEVGLGSEQPVWLERELEFSERDPELERWRAAGFTVALLADDPRFWAEPEHSPEGAASALDTARPLLPPSTASSARVELDARASSGTGLVAGAWRLGAEVRARVALSSSLFATGSSQYAIARDAGLDLRWFDVSLGVGWYVPRVWSALETRLRVEGLVENLAATAERGSATDRRSAWIPGVLAGADLIWPLSSAWALSARVDGFWLDGSTAISSAGERLGTSAGAGILLGLGAGARF